MKKILNIFKVILIMIISLFVIENNNVYGRLIGGTTLFEKIGRYSIAIAGNNNATKGTGVHIGMQLINSYPSNWNTIKSSIPSNILSQVNNMSGSYLDINGEIVKSFIAINDVRFNYSGTRQLLLIKPDGSYQVLNTSGLMEIDISQKG